MLCVWVVVWNCADIVMLFLLSAVVRDTEGVQPAETDGYLGPPYATPDQILPPT